MATDKKIRAAVTSRGVGGLRGVEATEPILKRRPLSVVPNAWCAEVNIKKFPLISHKAAVNRTNALKVLAAWGMRQAPFLLGATGPLRCVTLGATLCRVPMSDEDEIHLHVTYAGHVDMDEAFCARLRNAIEAGLENAP